MMSWSEFDGSPSAARNAFTSAAIIRDPHLGHGNKIDGRDERPMFEPIEVLQFAVHPSMSVL
jgi:hypothetical protein